MTSVFQVLAVSVPNDTGISLQITGPPVCNNNGICEPELGENYQNCPLDCPPPAPPPAPPPTPGALMPDITPPVIYNLFISKITLNSAEISWKTNELALCQLFWGKTQEYKEEVITETTFYLEHLTKLIHLSPETTYHFKIVCKDTSKNESETKDQRFTTLAPPDITPPANISNFEAIPGDSQITLTWQNPPDLDFKGVRIVRSEKFYPENPWEGELVYDGKGTSFLDTGLTNGVRYYYTAFSYDFAGNFSSGAIVSAVPRLKPPPPPEEIFTEKECLEAGYYWYDDACHLEPKIFPAPPEIEKLTIEDFDFIQEKAKIPLIEREKIKPAVEKPLTVSLEYGKVPEVLKTIMVTLERDKKFFSFLLRINKEKTAYQATIMVPEESGIYPMTLTILDYKNQTLKKIHGFLEVFRIPAPPVPWYKRIKIILYIIYVSVGLLILAAIAYYLIKKRKKQKPKETSRNLLKLMEISGNKKNYES